MTAENKEFATEAGHWYWHDGEPCYEVPYADPKKGLRSTTLRDARKLDLVPSVTEIIKVSNKPGLNRWLIEQAYLAMATLPEIKGESIKDRIERAKLDAAEQANTAREKGVTIHGELEKYFKGDCFDPNYSPYVTGVIKKLDELFGPDVKWGAERSFAHPLGYGGKLDLFCKKGVVDFKTKEFTGKDIKKMAWDEHGMQLAAYSAGIYLTTDLGDFNFPSRMINLFISTTEPGLVVHHEFDDFSRYFDMFRNLLEFWQLSKNYESGF